MLPAPSTPSQPTDQPSQDLPVASPSDQEFLKALLADRDIACGNCGYNLRGITTHACPECGDTLALPTSLRSTLGLGPGACAIWVVPFGLSAVIFLLVRHGPGDDVVFFINIGILVIIGGLWLVAFGLARHRLSMRSIQTYWWVTRVIVSLYAFGLLVLFLATT